MKEFRIAECLGNNGIAEYAIFADGSRKKLIRNDEQYGKYFEVDNELNSDEKTCIRFSFSGRIKDAIDMIRNGNGDCIKSYIMFGRFDKVVYFINREIGEKVRKKFLEGWEDTKFGWAIECGNKNSMSGYRMLNKKMEAISVFNEDQTPTSFNSKDEATKYVEDLLEKARYYAKRCASGTNENERLNILDGVLDEIEEYTGTKCSIIEGFFFDMLTEDGKPKTPEYNLDEMGYKVVQCIVK